MSHNNGGYTIQQLGNSMDVNQQHMQSVAQQYELANRGSLEGWTQKTSPPQAALAASPSGESDDSDDSSAQNQGNEHEQQPQQQQSFNRPGPGYAQFLQYGPPSHSPPGMSHVQRQQMMAHQKAMNRHIMTGQTMNNQMVNTGQPMGNPGDQGSPMSNPGQPMHGGPQHIGMMQQHMGGQQVGQGMVPSPGQQGQMLGHNSPVKVPNRSPNSSKMQEQQQNQQQHNQAMEAMQQQSHQQQQYMQHQQAIANHQQMSMQQSTVSSNSTGQNGHQHAHPHGPDGHPTRCIRAGCVNPAVFSPEWDDEYCSNECVVSHCRDVFNAWVASNQAQGGNS
ncbi:uncharacterized protein LOC136026659 [Artemia franciscana]|uniref:uncharacterized protein LOC136026659 n=1 Tax=Artemia franciscana TaxID=6661 RepID=UPI0032DA33A9